MQQWGAGIGMQPMQPGGQVQHNQDESKGTNRERQTGRLEAPGRDVLNSLNSRDRSGDSTSIQDSKYWGSFHLTDY